jgi:hypothetical protein
MNLQVIASPDGEVLWLSGMKPAHSPAKSRHRRGLNPAFLPIIQGPWPAYGRYDDSDDRKEATN